MNNLEKIINDAKELFRELIGISYNNQKFYSELLSWIDKGSTVTLTKLLLNTTYKSNNINDFNAFATLDTVYSSNKLKR